jgi:starch phosphorylase
MRSVIAGFSAHRMLRDYVESMYMHARQSSERLLADKASGASRLAQWKQEVRKRWHGVSLRRVDEAAKAIDHGAPLEVAVAVKLNGLRADDVAVECQLGKQDPHGEFLAVSSHLLTPGEVREAETVYRGQIELALSGLVSYRLRAYPCHPLLSQAFEMGFMKWI